MHVAPTPKYMYILSLTAQGTARRGAKWSPHIGWSSNPFRRLNEHNRVAGHRGGRKTTRACAPHWRLELVVGGLTVGLREFRDQWRHKSRKLDRRIVWGVLYAAALANPRIQIYARDPPRVQALVNAHLHTLQ